MVLEEKMSDLLALLTVHAGGNALKAVQVSFVVEEWVDHALSKSQEAESKLAYSDKVLAEVEKMYKDSLFHLVEAERGSKNAEAALGGFKKQAEELRGPLILYYVTEMEEKLDKLSRGVTLVRPEDCKAVEDMVSQKLTQWRRRKRMFKDLWDAITENSPKDLREFKEELGIEYDEDVGVSLQSYSDLMQRDKKRPRGY
ncbi:hypothetical protein SO802_007041 [Lithocarpus litseifolius]|uniref:Leucine zipper with capping helix domain-containing protein n=1 Tax=Lithocarpus litseifolius TaxID=425828 RepID=A0AAW2DQT7_9ROSI